MDQLIPNEIARLMDEIRDLVELLLEIDRDGLIRLEVMMHHWRVSRRVALALEGAGAPQDDSTIALALEEQPPKDRLH